MQTRLSAGPQAVRERQPSVAARSIWEALYKHRHHPSMDGHGLTLEAVHDPR